MKFPILIACLLAVASASKTPSTETTSKEAPASSCYLGTNSYCEKVVDDSEYKVPCSSKFGGFKNLTTDKSIVFDFFHLNLIQNFKYLLLSTHFGGYELNRAGFSKLYRDMSDNAWNDAIKIAKYQTMRGGTFLLKKHFNGTKIQEEISINELQSLARAVDLQKEMAKQAHDVHKTFSSSSDSYYDPDVSSFMENNFMSKYSENIRVLSGHHRDLAQMLKDGDTTLATYLFDEYLQTL